MTGSSTSRIANCLLPDDLSDPSGVALPRAAERAVARSVRRHGGLWVGGRVTLTESTIEFHPNKLNRAFQDGLPDIVLDLSEVIDVIDLPGVPGSRIVKVVTAESSLTFRCFRAHKFSSKIREAVGRAGPTS